MTKQGRDEITYKLVEILRDINCPYEGLKGEKEYKEIKEHLTKALCMLMILDLEDSWD
jgi:Cdc6-like AAA superfamily ATPase